MIIVIKWKAAWLLRANSSEHSQCRLSLNSLNQFQAETSVNDQWFEKTLLQVKNIA
jgi:hypothetical protein